MEPEHKIFNLNEMKRGWFIGNFEPSVFRTDQFEVAVQSYPSGSIESEHFHKISTEFTVIVSGKCKMNERICSEGDIIVIEPGKANIFEALTDVITVVVKIPSSTDDKYLI